jgi:3-hydroxy acid dehydrogenase/malonic semialdehyde reductase
MKSLKDKVVFITGASSGIGRATAFEFARTGARLLLCARRLERLTEMEPQLRDAGAPAVSIFGLDVRERASVEAAIADLAPELANIEVLVNNAGLSRGFTKLQEDDPENWEEMIDTNIKGLLYVTRAVVPGMVATKAAEKAISEGLKIDLMGTPVRVTSVDPGMVETDFSLIRFRGDEERAAKVYQNITPLTPEDIADAIVWAATRPDHVNIHNILITTIDQANSTVFHRHS